MFAKDGLGKLDVFCPTDVMKFNLKHLMNKSVLSLNVSAVIVENLWRTGTGGGQTRWGKQG